MAQGPARPAASGDVAHVMTEEASHPGAWASVGTLRTCAVWGSRLLEAWARPVRLTPLRASLFFGLHHKSFHFSTTQALLVLHHIKKIYLLIVYCIS